MSLFLLRRLARAASSCRPRPLRTRPLPLLLAALLVPVAHADRGADEADLKSALYRQYSSSEADARFDTYRRNPDAATQALGSGLGNLANRMYERGMARQRAEADAKEQRINILHAVQAGKNLMPETAEERELLVSVLDEYSNQKNVGRYTAELLLGLRPNSVRVFGNRDMDAKAAEHLRAYVYPNRYAPEGWAVNMLANLYLTGRGVPRDEAEAWRLLSLCATGEANSPVEDQGTVRARCKLTMARMTEKGWGVDADPKRAAALREEAAGDYNKVNNTGYTAANIEDVVTP